MLDDLFTYRLGRDRFLTVTNAVQPREGPGLVPRARGGLRRRGRATRTTTGRCSPCRARARARSLGGARRRRRCPPRMRTADADGRRASTAWSAAPATRARTASSCCVPPTAPARSGTRCARRGVEPAGPRRARHAAARGLLPPLRQRPLRGPQPARGRPRLVLQARHGLHRRRRAARRSSPSSRSCRSPSPGPASRARAIRCDRRRRACDQRFAVARAWRSGSAWPTCPSRPPRPGTRDRGRRARQAARRPRSREAAVPEAARRPRGADGSVLPRRPKYHPEHDWARIEGDEATFGITWYAQDALGEVVFFDPPEVGAQLRKDQVYAEVESVKAVSDVFAPLSGEIVEVNEALADSPEKINEDPYGDGLDGEGASSPTRPSSTRCSTWAPTAICCNQGADVPLHLRHRRRTWRRCSPPSARLARRPVRRRSGRPAARAARSTCPPAVRAGGPRGARGARGAQPPRGRRDQLPRRGHVRPLRAVARRRARSSRSEFLTPYTPYQPEISQGGLQVMFEFQTAISELTGLPVSNASVYEGPSAVAAAGYLASSRRARRGSWPARPASALARSAAHPCRRLRHGGRGGAAQRRRRDRRRALAAAVDDDTAAVFVQQPNFLGTVEDLGALAEAAQAHGRAVRRRRRPAPAGHPRPPGELGADICVGEGQTLGNRLDFGGPSFGFFAAPRALHPPDAGPDRGRDARRRRAARVRAHAADARAAHPPREGHPQHLHRAGAERARRRGLPLLARASAASSSSAS